jgi:hypothetical protein
MFFLYWGRAVIPAKGFAAAKKNEPAEGRCVAGGRI